jgi:ADP-heptose:LPS heptosyltransferase
VFPHLRHVYDPRERLLVGVADAVLAAATWPARRFAAARRPRQVRRILLLRLERIGDLLMTLGAIEAARATWPGAGIDLAVGSWNSDLARLLPWPSRVEIVDAPWLSRGEPSATWPRMLAHARRWRRTGYDLVINLEGDIRSNLLAGLTGAPVRVGFPMAGGGSLLTHAVAHDPGAHTDENTRRLIREAAAVLGQDVVEPPASWPRLSIPAAIAAEAEALLAARGVGAGTPLVGLHASGGRAIKQWHPARFGEAAGQLASALGATVVMTGTPADRPLVDAARAALAPGTPVVDLAGPLDLVTLAAVLARVTIYVTGDTGPMHLAAAMGTPVVAVFGLSDPARYAPLAPHRRIVRIDLPCAPCNRVRLPPERCRGHVPDCL